MSKKRKVTFTFYTDEGDTNRIQQKLVTSRRIRMEMIARGENMAQWGRKLGVSRQYVYQVVKGIRRSQRVRGFIEQRLNQEFWPKHDGDKRTRMAGAARD